MPTIAVSVRRVSGARNLLILNGEMSEWLKEHVDHTACPSSPPRPRRNEALATAVMRELRIDANDFVM